MWRHSRSLSIILSVSISSACTQAVPPETPPLPKFESVAIVSKGPSEELKARFDAALGNSRAGTGAAAGAGAGAVAGAGLSLGCGPFVFFCAIVLPLSGALAGAIGGAVADAAVDEVRKPSQEQLAVLDGLFGEVVAQRTLDVEIRDALVQQVPPGRFADLSSAEALIQLSLFDVQFMQTSSGKYTLTLKSLMIAQWNQRKQHLNNGRRLYRHTTRALSLKKWAENDGEILNQAFDECVDGLGEQMAADIQFRDR